MERSSCAFQPKQSSQRRINVGDAERMISTLVGGVALLYGFSKLSLPTIVASLAGGALLFRGLTGHCSLYEALEMSTDDDRTETNPAVLRQGSRHGVTDASLAATGESPRIS